MYNILIYLVSKAKIITDEPTLEDALDYHNHSRKLTDIIRNSTPRFAIGIFGGWGTGKTSLMKMIEERLKGYVFRWEDIPGNKNENGKLKNYLIENISNNLEWIKRKDFIKSTDKKTISISDDVNNGLSISIIDDEPKKVLISINNSSLFENEFFVEEENGTLKIYRTEPDILTVWFNPWKYENEKYLALIPSLRQINIALEKEIQKARKPSKWRNLGNGFFKTLNAFVDSTTFKVGSTDKSPVSVGMETKGKDFKESFTSSGTIHKNAERVLLQEDPTDYFAEAIRDFRKGNRRCKQRWY